MVGARIRAWPVLPSPSLGEKREPSEMKTRRW